MPMPPRKLAALRLRLGQLQRIVRLLEATSKLSERITRKADPLKESGRRIPDEQNRLVAEAERGGHEGEVMTALRHTYRRAENIQRRTPLLNKTLRVTEHKVSAVVRRLMDPDKAVDRLLERLRENAERLHSLTESKLTELDALTDELDGILKRKN